MRAAMTATAHRPSELLEERRNEPARVCMFLGVGDDIAPVHVNMPQQCDTHLTHDGVFIPPPRRVYTTGATTDFTTPHNPAACPPPKTLRKSDVKVPKTFKEAQQSPQQEYWRAAVQAEYDSLCAVNAWETCELPADRKAIPSKWVFDLKVDADGFITRFKARLVLKGFRQLRGVDFYETYSPVVSAVAVRLVLALLCSRGWASRQIDFRTAFLNSEMKEELYMTLPEGFQEVSPEGLILVGLVLMSIYGTKQAGLNWYRLARDTLLDLGFIQSEADLCLFKMRRGKDMIYVCLYVDDLNGGSANQELIDWVVAALASKFKIEDQGEISWYLKQRIVRTQSSLFIIQDAYVDTVLARYGMTDCKGIATPAEPNTPLSALQPGEEKNEDFPYQGLVGSVLYLVTKTRPDIAYATSRVAKFSKNHGERHWLAGKRILRYLKATSNWGIRYLFNSSEEVYGYCDADWAGDPDNRLSTSGYIFMACGGPISWRTKAQDRPALSSAEAEFYAITEAVQEALYLLKLLKFLECNQKCITIYCDNMGAIAMLKEEHKISQRSKHIDLRYAFIRDAIRRGEINIVYIPTEDNLADLHTKALNGPKLASDRNKILSQLVTAFEDAE